MILEICHLSTMDCSIKILDIKGCSNYNLKAFSVTLYLNISLSENTYAQDI